MSKMYRAPRLTKKQIEKLNKKIEEYTLPDVLLPFKKYLMREVKHINIILIRPPYRMCISTKPYESLVTSLVQYKQEDGTIETGFICEQGYFVLKDSHIITIYKKV